MKFSVLVAHYNNAHFFKTCYESIKSQTFQNFEIILVDDCSTDNSLEEIKRFTHNDSRVKIFENLHNEGVGYTKKKCVELANGEICGFVDPDDALMPTAIENSIKAFQNNNIVATYSKLFICNERLEIKKIFPNTRKIKSKDPLFFNIFFETLHFFTFKKDAYFKTDGINEKYTVAEDIDLYLKLYEKGDFYFINKPLYKYRVLPLSLSHDESKREIKKTTWNKVLLHATERRGLKKLYGVKIDEIEDLSTFIYKKQNTIMKKISRKLLW